MYTNAGITAEKMNMQGGDFLGQQVDTIVGGTRTVISQTKQIATPGTASTHGKTSVAF